MCATRCSSAVAVRRPIRRGSAGGTGGSARAACPTGSTLRSVERHAFVEAGQVERMLDAQRRAAVSASANSSTCSTTSPRLSANGSGSALERARARSPRSRRRTAVDGEALGGVMRRRHRERGRGARQACPLPRASPPRWAPFQRICGAVAEWSKALAWKVSIRQNRIEGSNPSRSATHPNVNEKASTPGSRNSIVKVRSRTAPFWRTS